MWWRRPRRGNQWPFLLGSALNRRELRRSTLGNGSGQHRASGVSLLRQGGGVEEACRKGHMWELVAWEFLVACGVHHVFVSVRIGERRSDLVCADLSILVKIGDQWSDLVCADLCFCHVAVCANLLAHSWHGDSKSVPGVGSQMVRGWRSARVRRVSRWCFQGGFDRGAAVFSDLHRIKVF